MKIKLFFNNASILQKVTCNASHFLKNLAMDIDFRVKDAILCGEPKKTRQKEGTFLKLLRAKF